MHQREREAFFRKLKNGCRRGGLSHSHTVAACTSRLVKFFVACCCLGWRHCSPVHALSLYLGSLDNIFTMSKRSCMAE